MKVEHLRSTHSQHVSITFEDQKPKSASGFRSAGVGLTNLTWCLAPYIRPLIFGFSNKVSGTGGFMFNAW